MSKSHNTQNDEKDEEDSKKLLNRKTKRENSSNIKLGDNLNLGYDIRCSICLEYENYSGKCHKCIKCFSDFHMDCYNLFTFSPESQDNSDKVTEANINSFICMRCKEENEKNNRINCGLCAEHDGIMKKKDDKYIHHYCYVFFKDNLQHVKNGKCKNCKIKNIPVIKCEYHGCKDKYHIKCALEKGIIFSLNFLSDDKNKENFNEKIPFYCENHNKVMIDNYAQFISAMADSMKDKTKISPEIKKDNNPINEMEIITNNN